MARRKRPAPLPGWLVPVLALTLLTVAIAAIWLEAVPVRPGEAALWRGALAGPVLPLDAAPLPGLA
uniref:hypothetical protein n=1 Tax=Roseobacter sp. HKCCA0434 TaxID=3079297 RepID=UPI002905DFBF